MDINAKFNYNETYYEEVDNKFREWRRSVWDDSLGDTPQEAPGQIGPSGWLEVDDGAGNTIVNIDGDGMVWQHADTHEDGGTDEINVEGLSGLLADQQDPLAHAERHENGGVDEISIAGLDGTPNALQAHLDDSSDAHDASAVSIVDAGTYFTGTDVEAALQELGADVAGAVTDHGALTGLADDDHPQYATNAEFDDHSARHENGGADEILVENLPTVETDTSLVLHPDGAGGIEWGADAGGGGAALDVQEGGVSVEDPVDTIDFGAGFDVTSPVAGEVEVAIDLGEVSTFTDHSARHENGGADEISLAGLDGTSTELANHLADATDAHDASAISVLDVGGMYTNTDVEGALAEVMTRADEAVSDAAVAQSDIDNHISDATDAHDASAISIADAGANYAATDVEGALAEVMDEVETLGSTTTSLELLYESIAPASFTPYALPPSMNLHDSQNTTNELNMVSAGNGGAALIPIVVPSPMMLESCVVRNADTASARNAEWRLYRDNGDATLDEIVGANGTWSFTPTAASNRESTAASAPVLLNPGIYWLVIRNTNTSRGFTVALTNAFQMGTINARKATSLGSLGSTLDTASFSNLANREWMAFLRGRVFGESTAY